MALERKFRTLSVTSLDVTSQTYFHDTHGTNGTTGTRRVLLASYPEAYCIGS